MNVEPDDVTVAAVEIGMRLEEGLGFGGGRFAKAIDVMMAVALGMRHADQRAEREILLHAEPGLAGQILAGNEVIFILPAPRRCARGVDDRLVKSLAGF